MRLFVAVRLPEEIKAHLQEPWERLQALKEVHWIPLESLHITLKFLGSVDQARVPLLVDKLDAVAEECSLFSIYCESPGVFPSAQRPRIFWTGIQGDRARLERLAEEVNSGMGELGFPKEERSFLPHLTLGRLKTEGASRQGRDLAERFSALFGAYKSPPFVISSFDLMRSHLSPHGSTYETLHVSVLKGSEP